MGTSFLKIPEVADFEFFLVSEKVMAGKLACSDLPVLFIVGPIGYQPNRGFHLLLLLLLLHHHHTAVSQGG